jgi:sucrose-phosphate synthase
MLITDIDATLVGEEEPLAKLRDLLKDNRSNMGFGVASGRSLPLVREVLKENGIEEIDVIIASVGTEIYYGKENVRDKGWASHLRSKWRPDRIHKAIKTLKFLTLQEEEHTQGEFKISYYLDDSVPYKEALPQIHDALAKARAAYNLVFSHGSFIDILPHRASKGKAIQYLAGKWNIPLERIATAGDSGNDRDMLIGQTAGIVVANHTPELSSLKKSKSHRVYFAKAEYAGGIIEGLQHYELPGVSPPKFKEDEREDEEMEQEDSLATSE